MTNEPVSDDRFLGTKDASGDDVMTTAWMLVLGIAGIATLYVLGPIVADIFARYRRPRIVRCPKTGTAAEILIDTRHAAATALVGVPELRVAECSRWPEHCACDQACLVSPGA